MILGEYQITQIAQFSNKYASLPIDLLAMSFDQISNEIKSLGYTIGKQLETWHSANRVSALLAVAAHPHACPVDKRKACSKLSGREFVQQLLLPPLPPPPLHCNVNSHSR